MITRTVDEALYKEAKAEVSLPVFVISSTLRILVISAEALPSLRLTRLGAWGPPFTLWVWVLWTKSR